MLAETPGSRLLSGAPDVEISGVTHDSRAVVPGSLFVAIPGFKRDGREFIPQAVASGAAAVASEAPVPEASGAARIQVASARAALADFATAFEGHPSRELTLIGVTGTDGKTSTTQLLSAVLEAAGRTTGWLTTVDLKVGSERRAAEHQHTTPEAVVVQRFLRELVDASIEVGVMEVSSHALALDRVRGCEFDLAIFTNLSPEHLNFHGTMEEYAETKAGLFRMLGRNSKSGPRFGIVNADDPWSERFRSVCPAPVLGFGVADAADVRASQIELAPGGSRFQLVTPRGQARVATRLIGRFNVLNWLAAAAAAHALGIGPEVVARAAAKLRPVPGRMESVDRGQPFAVVVDFAHTPQALENALRTLREHTSGRLLLLFGNAGERDPASRPAMGRIAAQLSDYFILSLDDPYDEDPLEIAEAAAAGAEAAGAIRGRDFEIDLDRRGAIQKLLTRAHPGDAVLLAGKGHESRMWVKGEKLPWNDRAVAEELLNQNPWT